MNKKSREMTKKELELYNQVKGSARVGYYEVYKHWYGDVQGPFLVLKETPGSYLCVELGEVRTDTVDTKSKLRRVTRTPNTDNLPECPRVISVRKHKSSDWKSNINFFS